MLKNSKTFKFLIGTFAVASLLVGVVASASLDFGTTTLRVGSKGAGVMALQTLVGATADGDFGPGTKAKVIAWQAANGLGADGVFGPMSMAKANATTTTTTSTTSTTSTTTTTSTVAGCGVGAMFSSTTGASCTAPATTVTGCAAGALFNSMTGASCTAATTVSSTGEGNLTTGYEAIPAANVVLNHGAEGQAAATFALKATGSNMKVSRLWVDLANGSSGSPMGSGRVWLTADTASLMDGSTVLATIPLSASTVNEVTTGALWELQFNGLNVTVPVGTTKDLTLAFGRPTLTQLNGTIDIAASSSVRAVDMAGFSNTYPIAGRTLNFTSAASTTGTLTTSLNVNSPAAQSVSGLSITAGQLTPVKLASIDLKGTNAKVDVTQLVATLAASTGTVANEVASVELRDPSLPVGSQVVSSVALATATATFSGIDVTVPQDSTKTVEIWAQMNPIGAPGAGFTSKGAGITATLTSGSTTALDASFNTVSVTSANVVGNTQYMYQYAPTLALVSTSATPDNENVSAAVHTGGNYSIVFTVTAPTGSDIYVNTPATIVGGSAPVAKTGAFGGTLASTTVASGVTSKGTVTLTTWDKVAAGTTRTFTVTAFIPAGGSAGYTGVTLNTNGIIWSDVDSGSGYTQTWGLSNFLTTNTYITT